MSKYKCMYIIMINKFLINLLYNQNFAIIHLYIIILYVTLNYKINIQYYIINSISYLHFKFRLNLLINLLFI